MATVKYSATTGKKLKKGETTTKVVRLINKETLTVVEVLNLHQVREQIQ